MNAMIPVTVHADDLEVIQRTAKLLAVSGYFDAKGDTPMAIAQIATRILAGRELGFGPWASVNGIYIINSRPSVGANLMASAVKASGRYDYRVREMSDKACRIEFFERTNGKLESLGVSEFTAEDAKKAGTKNIDKFARNMLFARAMSNGVRWYCPDVFSGNAVYVPEELGATVDGDGNVVDAPVRVVDAATGEILSPAPAPQRAAQPVQPQDDVDLWRPDDPTPAAAQEATERQALNRKLHAIGTSLYGKNWDAARHKAVEKLTQGAKHTSSELTTDELVLLVGAFEDQQRERQPA